MTVLKRTLAAVGIGLLLLVSLSMWAIASPVGASPDDDFHLASIWCGSGEREGLCGEGGDADSRLIPDKAASSPCYAFYPEQSPACQGEGYLDEGFTLRESSRVNAGSQYPSGFYFWSSLLASENIAVSTIAIRIAHSAVFAVLAVLTWTLLPRRLRPMLGVSLAVSLVPLGMFVIASTNPSSWAVTSGAIVFPALLGYFASEGTRRWLLGGVAVLAALLGLGARGDSAAYTVVAVAAALVLTFRPTRRFLLTAILPAVLVVLAAIAFLTAGQTGLALSGMGDSAASPTPKSVLLLQNLLSLPGLWSGAFGLNWGLGWLDTFVPPLVWATMIFLFAGALFAALHWQGWRKLVAVLGAGAAAVVVPLYILVSSGAVVGAEVQPRYILPLITLFVAVALAPSIGSDPGGDADTRLSPLQYWAIAAGTAVAQSVALYYNLRRYVVPNAWRIDRDLEWWWSAGPSPLLAWIIGTLAFAGVMAVFAYVSSTSPRPSALDTAGAALRQ